MKKKPHQMVELTIAVSREDRELLAVLGHGDPEMALLHLADHAAQGVYRPGSWERQWLLQVFRDEWIEKLEPGDPFGRPGCEGIFQRPKKK